VFFRYILLIKYENVYLQAYNSSLELYNELKKYFNFYNNERFHQSLNHQTQVNFIAKSRWCKIIITFLTMAWSVKNNF
jgi:transposase InsO family protein